MVGLFLAAIVKWWQGNMQAYCALLLTNLLLLEVKNEILDGGWKDTIKNILAPGECPEIDEYEEEEDL